MSYNSKKFVINCLRKILKCTKFHSSWTLKSLRQWLDQNNDNQFHIMKNYDKKTSHKVKAKMLVLQVYKFPSHCRKARARFCVTTRAHFSVTQLQVHSMIMRITILNKSHSVTKSCLPRHNEALHNRSRSEKTTPLKAAR